MPFCSAPYCSNRSQRDGKKGISFHRLPVKRKNLLKQWLIKLGRDKKFLPKVGHLYVCSDHMPLGTARLPIPKCIRNETLLRSKCIVDQNIARQRESGL